MAESGSASRQAWRTGMTRAASGDSVVPAPLPHPSLLNDNYDVIAAVKFEALEKSKKEAIKIVAEQIESKFMKVNPRLPLLPSHSIIQKLTRLLDSEEVVRKKKATTYKRKIFSERLKNLFDVISCQCKILPCIPQYCPNSSTCTSFHIICSCQKELRIPDIEVPFVKDQRDKQGTEGGKMMMAGIDKEESVKIQKEEMRKKRKNKEAEDVETNLQEKRKEEETARQRVREELMIEVEHNEEVENDCDLEEFEVSPVRH